MRFAISDHMATYRFSPYPDRLCAYTRAKGASHPVAPNVNNPIILNRVVGLLLF